MNVSITAADMFWVKCSDDEQMFPITRGRVEQLIEKLPLLGYLWFSNTEKPTKRLREHDGIKILDFPTFLAMTSTEFMDAVHTVLGLRPLPLSEADPVLHSITKLGGGEEIYDKIRLGIQEQGVIPLKPSDDVKDDYEWRVFKVSKADPISNVVSAMLGDGEFRFASCEPDPSDPRLVVFYCRGPKNVV